MGYPNTTPSTHQPVPAGAPSPQEPISLVLLQALQRYEEVEERFIQLRDRLSMGPPDGKSGGATADRKPQGMIAQANDLRNTSARLQQLCSELEAML